MNLLRAAIVDVIGDTPLISLERMTKGGNRRILAKLEYSQAIRQATGIIVFEEAVTRSPARRWNLYPSEQDRNTA